MKLIGLTGGIGTGKSTVSEYLAERGYPIIDADKIAREIVEVGQPALKEIEKKFGKDIINHDGSLNRKALATIVFSDNSKRKVLEDITMPQICKIISERVDLLKKQAVKIAFLDAPLLFEAGLDSIVDFIFCVDADLETRINRVCERDGSTRDDVVARIHSQMSNDDKMKASDEIIDNSKGLSELHNIIDELLVKYE